MAAFPLNDNETASRSERQGSGRGESATVDHDLGCIGCDYNLRSLSIDSACPECGAAVGASLVPHPLSHESPAKLQSLVVGVSLLLAGLLLGCLAAPSWWLVPWPRLAASGPLSAGMLLMIGVKFVPLMLRLWGYWKINRAYCSGTAMGYWEAGHVVMIVAMIEGAFELGFAWRHLVPWWGQGQWMTSPVTTMYLAISWGAYVVGLIAMCRVLSRIALAAGDTKRCRQFDALAKGIVVTVAAVGVFAVTTGVTLLADPSYDVRRLLAVWCVMTVVLAVLVFEWLITNAALLRRRLVALAAQARQRDLVTATGIDHGSSGRTTVS